MIRAARVADRAAIEAIVRAAYSVYVERIGKPPGPMLDDYAALIDAGAVTVLEDAERVIAAIMVLILKADHLLLDNIAVRPDQQGQGLGRALIAFAEREARRLGFAELRLYTHQAMSENIALYICTSASRSAVAGTRPATTACSCANASLIFHNIYYATFVCGRPIEMSAVCQLEMTLPAAVAGGVWGDGTADERRGAIAARGAAGRRSWAADETRRLHACQGSSAAPLD